MRLVTMRTPGGTRAGRLDGAVVVELGFPDVGALLASGPGWAEAAAADGPRRPLDEARLAPPVPRPSKVFCLGLNYEPHIREMGRELPAFPTLFAKFACALTGPRDPILLPPESQQVDWEVELAFVIGRPVRRARGAEARAAIAGYAVLNDVSMRDWQSRTIEFLQGKTWQAATPFGPALVTPDELPGDGDPDLQVRCEVDGQVMQEARTGELLFGPAELVEYTSTVVALEPGDVVATGTPGGVGAGRRPPVFLRPGQVVRTVVEGLGELRNECVAEPVAEAAQR